MSAALDLAHVRRAPGQHVKPCPSCREALVDTGDGVWAHAIGVEPCGWKAAGQLSVVLGPDALEELALNLSNIEDWLRDSCTARHNDDMADVVHQAWQVIEDLSDNEEPA